ncbi:MAG: hypothetical protein BYD32DRAFT_49945 [Podila humilis]|nr:MAG: hypothetical protein BYD32DRAFT_49945 [Podila humilis]
MALETHPTHTPPNTLLVPHSHSHTFFLCFSFSCPIPFIPFLPSFLPSSTLSLPTLYSLFSSTLLFPFIHPSIHPSIHPLFSF